MLSKADMARIRALHRATERRAEGLFIAEGLKLVRDMLGRFACELLVLSEAAERDLAPLLERLPKGERPRRLEVVSVGFDFGRISSHSTPQPALALFHLPQRQGAEPYARRGLSLLLDNVQDPGNVGTIIRTANWYGVEHLLLSEGCADAFSPKVVQATMGALSEVQVTRLERVTDFLTAYDGAVYGTFLDGADIYTEATLPAPETPALLIMGSEGRGISAEVEPYVTHRLFIPPHRAGIATESLNVGVATAICLSEFRRAAHIPARHSPSISL